MPKKQPIQKRKRSPKTRASKQVAMARTGNNHNPTGKGGFQDRPQDRNNGRWEYENSYSYWLSKLERMTQKELKGFRKKYSDDEMTVAMHLAWKHTQHAEKDLGFAKERSDRTVGKPKQSIDHTTKDESLNPYANLTADELRKLTG